MEQVRAFIAIELPDELKRGLARLEARLQMSRPPGVKWVDPSGIHLTLKFLGDVAVDRISEITEAIAETAQEFSPFRLEVKELGVFPNLRRVQVAWAGISGETGRLSQLQQGLESNLAHLGFTPESRTFTPHLTIARLRNRALPQERQDFGQLIAATSLEVSHTIWVDAISLMRSQLTREGAIYSRFSSTKLNQK